VFRKEDYVSLEALAVLLGISIVCSVVAQALAGYSVGGFVIGTGVGFIGAVFGMWLASFMDLPRFYQVTVDGTTFPLVWSILGSAVLVAALGALSGKKKY
jgi:uncharacterized membrane protein YeaQ/YmgE (transglycosylase-associated protein family)